MLDVYKMAFCGLTLLAVSGCFIPASAHDTEIYYGVRTTGDDALTMRLSNSLEMGGLGYQFVPVDKLDGDSVVIFITSNLEVLKNQSGDYARFRVDFERRTGTVDSVVGQCPVHKIKICKDSILRHLRSIVRG